MCKEFKTHILLGLWNGPRTENEAIAAYICTIEELVNTEEQLVAVFQMGMDIVQGLIAAHSIERFPNVHGESSIRRAVRP
jgi:hypothetical protein